MKSRSMFLSQPISHLFNHFSNQQFVRIDLFVLSAPVSAQPLCQTLVQSHYLYFAKSPVLTVRHISSVTCLHVIERLVVIFSYSFVYYLAQAHLSTIFSF